MNTKKTKITTFNPQSHRAQVITLWQKVFGYEADHNEPNLVIDKKCAFDDGLFFLAVRDDVVVGTIMVGYDGHRGWIYAMAVLPELQKGGIGSALLEFAEKELVSRGCMKVNLQIMEGNEGVQRFYEANGYLAEKRVSMGKRVDWNIDVSGEDT